MVVALVATAVSGVLVIGREEMGMETGFDLHNMAPEVSKGHVQSGTHLELGVKGSRNAAE